MFTRLARLTALIFTTLILLTGCTPQVNFDGFSLIDDEGLQYGELEWQIAASSDGTTIPTRVTIEPNIGEVDFIGSMTVYPEQTTTYTLKAEAERTDGGLWSTLIKVTIYIGPRVDYSLFTDDNLLDCLEETGFTHIEQFTTLLCFGRDIENLEGIQQLTALTTISLDKNPITDFSPLGELPLLNTLSMSNSGISDLSSFPYIASLVNLSLYDNNISDVRPLQINSQLINLSLYNNTISDVSQFQPFTNLDSLFLKNNLITNVSALSQNTNLRALDLSNNQVSDGVIELETLSGVLALDLRENKPTSCIEYAQLFLKLGPVLLFNQCTFP